MAITVPIADVIKGNPVSAGFQPVKADVSTLLQEIFDSPRVDGVRSTNPTAGMGYAAGAGAAVVQITSRTTGVTINTVAGRITMFTAAGSATWARFTVTNSQCGLNDIVLLTVKLATGGNIYMTEVQKNIAAGGFEICFATTGGVASDAPIIDFVIIKSAIT